MAFLCETGAMMSGVLMAGRTGAAFAAQLGTMKVTQEIDALTTLGLFPLEFLVLPRMIALCLMMPLLCLTLDGCAALSPRPDPSRLFPAMESEVGHTGARIKSSIDTP